MSLKKAEFDIKTMFRRLPMEMKLIHEFNYQVQRTAAMRKNSEFLQFLFRLKLINIAGLSVASLQLQGLRISRITSKSNFLRISSKSSELTHPPTSEHDPLQVEQTISTMASYQITNLLEKVRNMRILTFHIEIFLQIIYERDGNGNL